MGKQKKEDILLLFTDTKTEDEDLYRFLDETQVALGITLKTIEDGRNIWGVFHDVRYMGNNRVDPCSKHLKRELAKRYIKANYKPGECALYVGIDWSEKHRLEKIKAHWSPYSIQAPMTERPFTGKEDVLNELKRLGIKPPRLYALGFPHNNCGGFCIKSGQAQFKMLLQHFPERYRYHEEEQERLFEVIGEHGFIRLVRKGKMSYLSLRQFREYLERGNEADEEDVGGCGCFA